MKPQKYGKAYRWMTIKNFNGPHSEDYWLNWDIFQLLSGNKLGEVVQSCSYSSEQEAIEDFNKARKECYATKEEN